MSNKKQSNKDSTVLLGFPDEEIELDNDAYATKIGGLPIWLDPKTPPSSQICHCKICKQPMYLIFQTYAPLPDSPYHRVMYVWACNKRSCMRKEGSFKVLRSHLVDEVYLKAQRQKEAEKRKREEKKKAEAEAAAKAKNTSPFGNGFQLGDLWGNNSNNMATTSTTSGFGTSGAAVGSGFGMMKTSPAPLFGSTTTKPTAPIFGNKTAASVVASNIPSTTDQLVEKMTNLGIQDPVDTMALPQFPSRYIYIEDETTVLADANNTIAGIDMTKYQEYLNMEKELLMEVDGADDSKGEIWQGETYEKQALPRGVDKQFKKFTERVEYAPSQCVRYDFNGQPLFYSALQPQQQQIASRRCPHCNSPRVFEFQLMPNILSVLPITEYASKEQSVNQEEQKQQQQTKKTLLDSWNVGMEFGTVLVFVCQKDCHPGHMEDVAYMEEELIVQYEMD
ncbi:programmed cell death protein 2 [Mycotypha africana]|uniref:programmed cell death protein 2 n=1 Tax=Mycotypha africana TaxID=64632 RepID=UPI002300344D|nr:programmed cell death protein 2 [Mycotypha africana]KAI8977137.1 programmed cell death protein 2 [Mycotypha africana]